MSSQDTPGWRTLAAWSETCRNLDAELLAEAEGGVFLVCKAGSALQVPDGPQATMRVNLKLIEAAKRGEFHLECPAWPLRRRDDSVYSFISVGRTPNCDVHIPDEGISKLHAIVRAAEGGVSVNDAGSRNKTFVDGVEAPKRGEGAPLIARPGTTLRFGNIETVLMTAEEFHQLVLDLSAAS